MQHHCCVLLVHPNEAGAGPVGAWLNKTRGWSIGLAKYWQAPIWGGRFRPLAAFPLSSLGGSKKGGGGGGSASSYVDYGWKVILPDHPSSLWLAQLMAHKCTWLHKRCRDRWVGGASGSRQRVQRQERNLSGHVLATWPLASLKTGPDVNLIIHNIKILQPKNIYHPHHSACLAFVLWHFDEPDRGSLAQPLLLNVHRYDCNDAHLG